MAVAFTGKVIPIRFDLEGNPDLLLHERATKGSRNKPVMTSDGSKQAVDEHGNPRVTSEEFVHVFIKPDGDGNPFHFECSPEEAVDFPIGKGVTVTVS